MLITNRLWAKKTLIIFSIFSCIALFNVNIAYGQNGCWKQISSGYYHTVAVKNDSSLWASGLNDVGQIGDGTLSSKTSFTQIGGTKNWKLAEAGNNFSIAIKIDGTLWGWGGNSYGQLGNGTNSDQNLPNQIGNESDWKMISAGENHTLAIKTDGTLWAWGRNNYGQLGDNTNLSKNIPTKISLATDWVIVSAGANHSLAIKADGTLWSWGRNNKGQLGDGTTTDKLLPVQIATGNVWESVDAGENHSVAITTNGTLWTWGDNISGQLGDGTNTTASNPLQVFHPGLTGWKKCSAGANFSMAIRADSSLWAFGGNSAGQLGIGSQVNKTIPANVVSPGKWLELNCGYGHTFAIDKDENLFSWGWNGYGQLADGSTNVKTQPVSIACPQTILSASIHHLQLLNIDGKVLINWLNNNESGIKQYDIQKSNDGRNFETIHTQLPYGNAYQYRFWDNNPFIGKNYYRIKEVKNSTAAYSEIKTITLVKNIGYNKIVIYPNPATDGRFSCKFNSTVKSACLSISDIQGKVVFKKIVNTPQVAINSNLPKGIYLLSILTSGYVETTKLVIE